MVAQYVSVFYACTLASLLSIYQGIIIIITCIWIKLFLPLWFNTRIFHRTNKADRSMNFCFQLMSSLNKMEKLIIFQKSFVRSNYCYRRKSKLITNHSVQAPVKINQTKHIISSDIAYVHRLAQRLFSVTTECALLILTFTWTTHMVKNNLDHQRLRIRESPEHPHQVKVQWQNSSCTQ